MQRGALYAKERIVFERPIGMNQSIQHPLARSWMELEAWIPRLAPVNPQLVLCYVAEKVLGLPKSY